MEGQELNVTPTVETELEEDVIPVGEVQTNEGGLDDVVPCEYVAVEQQQQEVSYDMAGSTVDGLYNDESYYTPSVSTEQMVDIGVHVVGSSGNELEEVEIPNEENTLEDEQLDDVA